MDINNVLEGTRQYFMGVPKPAQAEESGQPVWPASAAPPEEGAPAQSGAPTPSSRPPSAAAAPAAPPRPPSEPLEPEPHIIHKATVMREAAEKRRELKEPEDAEDASSALSPPSHIIHKPAPRPLMSPAPAPAAPSPSPARPPSAAPIQITSEVPALPPQHYRLSVPSVQNTVPRPQENFAAGRPPDLYSVSRPPEYYNRYPYEPIEAGRRSQGASVGPSQLQAQTRQSPQTYARMTNALPQHSSSRLRDMAAPSPPAQQRYFIPTPPIAPPTNDRVPPIHHPQLVSPIQRPMPVEGRSASLYTSQPQRREAMAFAPPGSQYERLSVVPPRKYDPQQAYSGYRQSTTTNSHPARVEQQRVESHQQIQYKRPTIEPVSSQYTSRPADRPVVPQQYPSEVSRFPQRVEYSSTRTADVRSGYQYPTASTSTSALSAGIPQRPVPVPQNNYEYPNSNIVPNSVRPTVKTGCSNQQTRMTVSVTSIMNEMNQTKQKRESPLDLSVKTVKNSADSSTTQDDAIDSMTNDNKTMLQPRSSSSSRYIPQPGLAYSGSHKVDFAPDFKQYRERNNAPSYPTQPQTNQSSSRYNGSYSTRRQGTEPYHESRPQHTERFKSSPQIPRPDNVPRIDLTKPDERIPNNRIRDDRHLIIEERKRMGGPVVSNIPEKMVRYETWPADSRTDRLSQSAREQDELMRRPVYSYRVLNEQKRPVPPAVYGEHYPHPNSRYPGMLYPPELTARGESRDYHTNYHERISSSSSRHVIQKTPTQRDLHHHNVDHHNGVPADKRVLSILRNSLETKQTGLVEPTKPIKQIPELIVIDDADDSEIIEITDLTRDNDLETFQSQSSAQKASRNLQNLDHHIRMPKAIDSIARENDNTKLGNVETKSKSPENDVASRIRTKAELKVMPPSQDQGVLTENKQINDTGNNQIKIVPKSQKQHLFNQIRQDNLRLESVIKSENSLDGIITEVKSEPMNIEEIERDATLQLKTENTLDETEAQLLDKPEKSEEDLFWSSACDSFMEQLKSGAHKKKSRKRIDTIEQESDNTSARASLKTPLIIDEIDQTSPSILCIKQEPIDEDEVSKSELSSHEIFECSKENTPEILQVATEQNKTLNEEACIEMQNDPALQTTIAEKVANSKVKNETENNSKGKSSEHNFIKNKQGRDKDRKKKLKDKETVKIGKNKISSSENNTNKNNMQTKTKTKLEKHTISTLNKKEKKEKEIKKIIKEETESTDDDEPLIKSKLLKDKEKNDRLKFQLLKDLSEKSAYVKLECFEVDMNKNTRISIDSSTKDKEDKPAKGKSRQSSRFKKKSINSLIENLKTEKQSNNSSSSDSDDDMSVASRLRMRKHIKPEDNKSSSTSKTLTKSSHMKKLDVNNASTSSTPAQKLGFGDGSYFHPGWEEELYKYKRSLRMPPRLIAIPRGRSGGPAIRGPGGAFFNRGSTSLPDLDPAPLSPAPSSAPSAATDDLYSRRQEKLNLDSDAESNSSYSTPYKLHYDSEASTSTVLSTSKFKRKNNSIVDVLIQKYGQRDETLKKKNKDKDDNCSKVMPKAAADLALSTIKSGSSNKENSNKKEQASDDIFHLGEIKVESTSEKKKNTTKNAITSFKTRTENKTPKHKATLKAVFGDERPASAPPVSCRDDDSHETEEEPLAKIKKDAETKTKFKSRKLSKDGLKRKLSATRDGLRSSNLKRNDAKGRMLRLKKRNSIMQSLAGKRIREISTHKNRTEKNSITSENDKTANKDNNIPNTAEGHVKKRFKRLFGRKKFSSGFDYIRKKKKIIRKDNINNKIIRRFAPKPSPESVQDISKEVKGWFINKSVGETHLHRAARLGYIDCVAYCLEKMEADPSAKDNAGFTPLHVASACGHVRIARILLQYGANVSAAAQGGIRPLHEASENCHVEVIRLLLAYGADPILGTYAGQTPEELAEGVAATFIRLYIADVQGKSVEPWRFPPPTKIIDQEEQGCDPLASPPPASPPPLPDATIEIQCTEAPLPPFYTLRTIPGQTSDGLWCLLQDITNILQIKSKDSLLKQIHCGSGSPKELFREIRTQEFLERAQCHQLLCAGEKVNVRASKVALVRVTDKLRQLLKIETVLVS